MYCVKCGSLMAENSKFCSVCGSKVEVVAAPQPVEQTPPQPATEKKKSSVIAKIWIPVVAAVVLIAAVLGLRFVMTSSLQQMTGIEYCNYASISVKEYGTTTQEMYVHDLTTSQDLWKSVCGVRLKKSTKDLYEVEEEIADQVCMSAYFSDMEDYIALDVYENGVVYVRGSEREGYCTGGKGLYKKLMKLLPQETFRVGDTFRGKSFNACQLRLRTTDREEIKEFSSEEAKRVADVVDMLEDITVEMMESSYEQAAFRIDVNLYTADNSLTYMIAIDSLGYGTLYADDWSYDIYSLELYDQLYAYIQSADS